MLPPLRTLILVVAAAGLVGCATPRYQTAYRYEPPVDAAGRACLEKCEQKLAGCQQRCTADYQACLKDIEPQVEERYGKALKRYEAEWERYRWERERYELYLSLNWGYPLWFGPGFYHPWPGFYQAWPGPYYFPPALPRKPSRDEEFKRLQQEKCDQECGCQTLYDACFLSCGGKRIPEVRCIANCPKEK